MIWPINKYGLNTKEKKSTANYEIESHPTTNIVIHKAIYTNLLNTVTLRNPVIKIELSPIIPWLFDYNIKVINVIFSDQTCDEEENVWIP